MGSKTKIVLKRPDDRRRANFLYNTALKKVKWEKVTMIIEETPEIVTRLESAKIPFYRLFTAGKEDLGLKSLVQGLLLSLKYVDKILSTILTNKQISALDVDKLREMMENMKKAEAITRVDAP